MSFSYFYILIYSRFLHIHKTDKKKASVCLHLFTSRNLSESSSHRLFWCLVKTFSSKVNIRCRKFPANNDSWFHQKVHSQVWTSYQSFNTLRATTLFQWNCNRNICSISWIDNAWSLIIGVTSKWKASIGCKTQRALLTAILQPTQLNVLNLPLL